MTTTLSAGDLTISMTESSSEPPDIARSRAIPNAHGVSRRSSSGLHSPPVNEPASSSKSSDSNHVATTSNQLSTADHRNRHAASTGNLRGDAVPGTSSADEKFGKLETGSVSTLSGHAAAVASPKDEVPGAVVGAAAPRDGSLSIDNSHQGNNNNNNPADDGNASKKKRGFVEEVRRTFWMVVTYSWLNVLLVFVPIGIVVANVPGVHGGIVFAMNCIAVIPLAGLLSFATESVASNMGDSLGALLNVTFGNAVELIIL